MKKKEKKQEIPRVGKRGRSPLIDWYALDWEKQDIELAEQTGMSRERVRQRRKELGYKRPKAHRERRNSAKVFFKDKRTNTLTLKELQTLSGFEVQSIKHALNALGKKWKEDPQRSRWKKLTEEQYRTWPDPEIAKYLGVKLRTVQAFRQRRGYLKFRSGIQHPAQKKSTQGQNSLTSRTGKKLRSSHNESM